MKRFRGGTAPDETILGHGIVCEQPEFSVLQVSLSGLFFYGLH
jgi:hypothetical protein